MAFSKFDPHRPEQPPSAAEQEAGRRAWILKWGNGIAQGMFYLGVILMLYWLGKEKHVW